ncbi:MAG: phage protein Gp27 family protein [Ruthenibacterium sp.]
MMEKRKNRKHSIIDGLPAELKNAAEQMLLSGATYSDVVAFLGENGVSLSVSAVCRYAKSFHASVETLQIAQENFRYMMTEAERYPDLDTTEVLTRIASQNLLNALINKPEEDWALVDIDKMIHQISGLTRAVAYKKRVEIQNKDDATAALGEVESKMFAALSSERPELYKQVSAFLAKKQKEGL